MLNKLRRLCLIALICIVHLVAFYFLNKNKIFLKYQQPKLMLVVNLTKDVNKESIREFNFEVQAYF